MSIREQLIHFQNQAERDFQDRKSLTTAGRYGLALVVFFSSTLLATFTLPVRAAVKALSHKETGSPVRKMNSDNIDRILKEERLVLIDFWAEWCGPCVMMNPVIDKFAASTDVTVAKVNADTNKKIVDRFKVRGLPHWVLVRNEHEIKRHAGPMTLPELKRFCAQDQQPS